MVRDIVSELLAHGFLNDRSRDVAHTLADSEMATYAAEIAFIELFKSSAASMFERFRSQRALVVGSGMTALALVDAILQAGIRETTVWVTDECATPLRHVQAIRERSQQRDPAQILREHPVPNWHDEQALQQALEPYDVIFHLSDLPMLARMMTLNTLCLRLQKLFLPALILKHEALIGPLVGPGERGCWECAWRRWLARNGAAGQQAERDPWQDDRAAPIDPSLGLPTAATIAHVLGFESFKSITGAGECEIKGRVLQFNLQTLRCEGHGFLPHPLCHACQSPAPPDEAAFLETARRLELQEPLDAQGFDERIVPCFDPSFGIFTSLGEDELAQTPLNVSRLTISAPMYPQCAQETITLTRAHLTFDTTRRKVTLAGAAHYAARVVDQRRLVRDTDRSQALTYDLYTKTVRWAPAAEAYPALDDPLMSRVPLGVSAGLSWAEACVRALLDHCLVLALDDVGRGDSRYMELAVTTQSMEGPSLHLHRLLERAEVSPRIFRIRSALQAPILAFCLGDETIVYTAHFDVAQALEEGLERVVQRLQAVLEEQHDYATPPVLQLLSAGCEVTDALSDTPVLHGWQEGLEWLVERFHQENWRVMATPLHHDPELADTLPFLVHVSLARREA
jgi:bacteriocin biosynthesis cyclodehydratase domain-containing protein